MRHTENLVLKALQHVAEIHPSVTQVFYDEYLRWCYCDDNFIPVQFTGEEDIGLLEDAADQVMNYPCMFRLEP